MVTLYDAYTGESFTLDSIVAERMIVKMVLNDTPAKTSPTLFNKLKHLIRKKLCLE